MEVKVNKNRKTAKIPNKYGRYAIKFSWIFRSEKWSAFDSYLKPNIIYYTVQSSVIPAEAEPVPYLMREIHNPLIFLDSRLRGNDGSADMIFL